MDYKAAGVDIDEGARALRKIAKAVRGTHSSAVLGGLGGFGGLFDLSQGGYQDPVLVSSIDGVGTKLLVARLAGQFQSIGADLVNHCVNDILVQGAKPLFFLDYVGMGSLEAETVAALVEGMAEACGAAGCALLGGETAEMPGLYAKGDFDVVGAIVGIVERSQLLDGRAICAGDVAVGLYSTGLHTNGYSLARRILFDLKGYRVDSPLPGGGQTVGEVLLAVHRSYAPALRSGLAKGLVHGLVHITGGGMLDNIPRVLPDGLGCLIDRDAWRLPEIFQFLGEWGDIPEVEMYRTFNMGIGLVAFCDESDAEALLADARRQGIDGAVIGRTIAGGARVILG
jgi:phosphoribosylformylglycinamidine cyclo-ligase